jgi:lysophospholipase L1-like esterase/pimeloyl-ACP methyl ester carboxylesterase
MNRIISKRRQTAAGKFCIILLILSISSAFVIQAAESANALAKFENVHRILFLGDSITYAGQYVEDIEACYVTRFPERRFEFINVGLSSETVSGLSEEGHAGGKYPRPDLHERLGRILAKTKPDLIFACYGMNDGIYSPFDEERFKKFQEGMKWLHAQADAAHVRIIHLTPPVFDPLPIASKTASVPPFGFSRPAATYNEVLDRYSDWLLAQRAAGWEVVDVHGPMNHWLAEQRKHDTSFVFARDGVHPDAAGHWVMAKQILLHLGVGDVAGADRAADMLARSPRGVEVLKLVHERQQLLRDAWLSETGHTRPGVKAGLPVAEAEAKAGELDKQIRDLAAPAENPAPFPGKKSEWQGFDRYDFEVNGKPAIVVAPKQALPGRPWAWRGEFFGAFPNADVALVATGFHLAYLKVPDLFGSPEAVGHWNGFYEELTTKYGLAKKPALIGLSRGGLYCYNWAIANPGKVACIYADAPVCDFKSWPGGRRQVTGTNGSANDWKKLLEAYGFHSDAEALAYRGNPVDNLKPLADARVPLLHVYGEADHVVPWQENTGVVAERYRKLGGGITLIPKPGMDHHPHGLTDPAPIVEFILKHAGREDGQN